MFDLMDNACDVQLDPHIQEWLDYETSQFIENELSESADWHRQWLADVCGLDDLFDVRVEMRAWWDEQVRSFRHDLLRQHFASTGGLGWHEDFALESRRQLALFDGSGQDLF